MGQNALKFHIFTPMLEGGYEDGLWQWQKLTELSYATSVLIRSLMRAFCSDCVLQLRAQLFHSPMQLWFHWKWLTKSITTSSWILKELAVIEPTSFDSHMFRVVNDLASMVGVKDSSFEIFYVIFSFTIDISLRDTFAISHLCLYLLVSL